MFKKTLLIITSTIFIAQLASFYEKEYRTEKTYNFNTSSQLKIVKEKHCHEYLDNKPIEEDMLNRKTSPRLYTNAKIYDHSKFIHTPLYTMLNMKYAKLIANS
jgi:hypothetical protein